MLRLRDGRLECRQCVTSSNHGGADKTAVPLVARRCRPSAACRRMAANEGNHGVLERCGCEQSSARLGIVSVRRWWFRLALRFDGWLIWGLSCQIHLVAVQGPLAHCLALPTCTALGAFGALGGRAAGYSHISSIVFASCVDLLNVRFRHDYDKIDRRCRSPSSSPTAQRAGSPASGNLGLRAVRPRISDTLG